MEVSNIVHWDWPSGLYDMLNGTQISYLFLFKH